MADQDFSAGVPDLHIKSATTNSVVDTWDKFIFPPWCGVVTIKNKGAFTMKCALSSGSSDFWEIEPGESHIFVFREDDPVRQSLFIACLAGTSEPYRVKMEAE